MAGMFMPRLCVVLPATDRAQLLDVAASGRTPQKVAIRAQLLLWRRFVSNAFASG